MKIYMDVCCLCRPFDTNLDDRIKLEKLAILILFSKVEQDSLTLISSEVIETEISKIFDYEKKLNLIIILSLASNKIIIDEEITERAIYFGSKGIKAFDALHLACAEKESDYIFTVDKDFLKKARKITDLKIKIMNPAEYLMKELI